MDRLLQLLAALLDWFSWMLRSLWNGFVGVIQTVWGKWLLVVGWFVLMLTYAKDMLYRLSGIIGTWMFESFNLAIPNGVMDALSVLNYLVPLVETLLMTIAYMNVIVIMALYRHVKSYVPGPVSGGT